MSDSQNPKERVATTVAAETVAWSYEWHGDADDGPTRWHKRLSDYHPTDGLPASYAKDYRNIRALAFADVAQAVALGPDAPEPPDDRELEAWRSAADELLRCPGPYASVTRRAAHLLHNAYIFGTKLRERLHTGASQGTVPHSAR